MSQTTSGPNVPWSPSSPSGIPRPRDLVKRLEKGELPHIAPLSPEIPSGIPVLPPIRKGSNSKEDTESESSAPQSRQGDPTEISALAHDGTPAPLNMTPTATPLPRKVPRSTSRFFRGKETRERGEVREMRQHSITPGDFGGQRTCTTPGVLPLPPPSTLPQLKPLPSYKGSKQVQFARARRRLPQYSELPPAFPSNDLLVFNLLSLCRTALHRLFVQYSVPTPNEQARGESASHANAKPEQLSSRSSQTTQGSLGPLATSAGGWQKVKVTNRATHPKDPKPNAAASAASGIAMPSDQHARMVSIQSLLYLCQRSGLYKPSAEDPILPLPPPLPKHLLLIAPKAIIDASKCHSPAVREALKFAPPLSLHRILDAAFLSASIILSSQPGLSAARRKSIEELRMELNDGEDSQTETREDPETARMMDLASTNWYLTFFDFCVFLVRLASMCAPNAALIPSLYANSSGNDTAQQSRRGSDEPNDPTSANQTVAALLIQAGCTLPTASRGEMIQRQAIQISENHEESATNFEVITAIMNAAGEPDNKTKSYVKIPANQVETQLAYLLTSWLHVQPNESASSHLTSSRGAARKGDANSPKASALTLSIPSKDAMDAVEDGAGAERRQASSRKGPVRPPSYERQQTVDDRSSQTRRGSQDGMPSGQHGPSMDEKGQGQKTPTAPQAQHAEQDLDFPTTAARKSGTPTDFPSTNKSAFPGVSFCPLPPLPPSLVSPPPITQPRAPSIPILQLTPSFAPGPRRASRVSSGSLSSQPSGKVDDESVGEDDVEAQALEEELKLLNARLQQSPR